MTTPATTSSQQSNDVPAEIAALQAQVSALTARLVVCEQVMRAIAYPPNVGTCMWCGRDPARAHDAACAVAVASAAYGP